MTPVPSTHPAERETPAGEARREAVAQWFVASLGKSSEQGRRAADDLLSVAGPIASELARLTAERDEAREDHVRAEAHICALEVLAYIDPEHTWKDAAVKERFARIAAEAALTTLRADHAAEVARLKLANSEYRDASGYLVQRYSDLHAGKPVRDLQEASAHFASSAAALDALATTETTDA